MTILSLPIVVVARTVAAMKARQAVSKSSVKISGRDVAATWKVLVALGLVPILWFVYTWLSGILATSVGMAARSVDSSLYACA